MVLRPCPIFRFAPAMNPFEEHAQNMLAYEGLLAEPINGVTGNTITTGLFISGGARVATAVYPATVGHFMVRQVLGVGGFSPRLIGQAIVRKEALPAGAYFTSGQIMDVAQVGGSVRH